MSRIRYFDANVDSEEDYEDSNNARTQKKKGPKRDETYVTIGTPLPEIEGFDAEAKKTTRPVVQARVHGEKLQPGSDMPRFHGAFTGGFSAGYFNTVGSKEGFNPATFVSSRQNRAQHRGQKAADYMDEEDISEHGIAPREIRTSDSFTSVAKNEKETAEAVKRLPSTVIPDLATGLVDIISPAESNIGVRLLFSMGFKRGQKAVPKISEERKITDSSTTKTKIYGCSLPPDYQISSDEDINDSEEMGKLKLVIHDFGPVHYKPKADLHGLGYSGVQSEEASVESAALFAGIGKRGIRGQAFGVGYDGDDPEDADIYSSDSIKNYDFSLDNKESNSTYLGWTAPALIAPEDISRVQDGRCLKGFYISRKPLFRRERAKLPELPRHFKPIKGGFNPAIKNIIPQKPSRFDQSETMNAKIRAQLLSGNDPEDKLSVFALIKPEDKLRLNSVAAASKPKLQEEYDTPEQKSSPSKSTSTFDPRRPFASEPEKQCRYEAFLQFRHINKDYSDLDLPIGMTEWEQKQEREQFERAARLLQPLSWSISQRFTKATEGESEAISADPLADKKQAVKMKMFGNLTRSVSEWHPAPLVCKRFNVRNPFPDSQIIGQPKVRREKTSIFNFLNVTEMPNSLSDDTISKGIDQETTQPESIPPEENRENDSTEENDEPEEPRPSMDIFAAIFGEESDEEHKTAQEDSPMIPDMGSQHEKSFDVLATPSSSETKPEDLEKTRREEGINAFLTGIFGHQSAAAKSISPKAESYIPKLLNEPVAPSSLDTSTQKSVSDSVSFGPKLPINLVVGVPTVHDAVESSSSYSSDDVQIISSESEQEIKSAKKKSRKIKSKRKDRKKRSKKHKRKR